MYCLHFMQGSDRYQIPSRNVRRKAGHEDIEQAMLRGGEGEGGGLHFPDLNWNLARYKTLQVKCFPYLGIHFSYRYGWDKCAEGVKSKSIIAMQAVYCFMRFKGSDLGCFFFFNCMAL